MSEFIDILFWGFLSFMVADYAIGRMTVRDPFRAVLAVVFAVLFLIFVKGVVQ